MQDAESGRRVLVDTGSRDVRTRVSELAAAARREERSRIARRRGRRPGAPRDRRAVRLPAPAGVRRSEPAGSTADERRSRAGAPASRPSATRSGSARTVAVPAGRARCARPTGTPPRSGGAAGRAGVVTARRLGRHRAIRSSSGVPGPLTVEMPGPLVLAAPAGRSTRCRRARCSRPGSRACCPAVPRIRVLRPAAARRLRPADERRRRSRCSVAARRCLLLLAPLHWWWRRRGPPAAAPGALGSRRPASRRSTAGPTTAKRARWRRWRRRGSAALIAGRMPAAHAGLDTERPAGRAVAQRADWPLASWATCCARSTRPGSATRRSRMRSGSRAGPRSWRRASCRRPRELRPAVAAAAPARRSPSGGGAAAGATCRRRGYSDVSIPGRGERAALVGRAAAGAPRG